jgi:pimeloyl-ACP methyl ester carboxylesterase
MIDDCLGARITTVDGRPVRYRIVSATKAGSRSTLGLPLLLIHGLGCSSEAWGPSLQWIARRQLDQPVIAPDMPGCGHSKGPRGALGIPELADWAARLLDGLSVPRAHVAAHSMGCQVALALARRHPERVERMVLAAPTTGKWLMPAWRYLAGMVRPFREPLAYRPMALRLYLQMGSRRYLATVRQMLADDPLAEIDRVTAPCLVVCGSRDAITPRWVAGRLAAALPHGTFKPVAGAGHVIPYHQPAIFSQILLDFLAAAGHPVAAPPAEG